MRHVRAVWVALGLAALAGSWASARSGDDDHGAGPGRSAQDRKHLGVDPGTGRDLLRYPPSPGADFVHLELQITIPDMNTPRFDAVETLTLVPVGRPLARLTLDAHLLDVKEVSAVAVGGQRNASFSNDGRRLVIDLDPPVPVGRPEGLVIRYSVNDPPQGLIWTPESPAWPGRAAQLHTQGEPETNSYWFPCHDSPNERLTTELVVTVPDGFLVSANGRLVGRTKGSGDAGPVETFRWLQNSDHVSYLVSLVVGKFDVEDVGNASLPMPVYVPPGRGGDVRGTYGRTAAMVDLFGKLLDEPYPWDRYAQLVVWNFGAGGMENTSATTMYDTAIIDRAALDENDLDGLISHELGHQWFGDLITCRSWEHIWLNEGFASYVNDLWFEHRDRSLGDTRRREPWAVFCDAYLAGVRAEFDSVAARDRADAPYQAAMVSKVWDDPWEVFRREANPYPKGAAVLHMLRARLGDERFFRALASYVDRFKHETAETNDLRKTFEDSSGESLERFFTQWCYRPGIPDVDVSFEWDGATRSLGVTVRQTQTVNDDNPAFAFSLPVWITGDSWTRLERIDVDSRETSETISLPGQARAIAVDPNLEVLSRLTVHQPQVGWRRVAASGPTYAARVQAVRALGEPDGEPAEPSARAGGGRNVLVDIALKKGALPALRVEAIRALEKRRDAASLLRLSNSTIDDVAVREALITSLAAVGKDQDSPERFVSVVAQSAEKDPSQRCRAAAVRGLGTLGAIDHVGMVLAAAEAESQHDRVRQAALQALGDLDAPEGLAAAIRCAAPGTLNRTRPVAIEALGKLAHHDPEVAYGALAGLLRDRERRAWDTAGRTLVKLGDARALDEFSKLAGEKRDPADRRVIERWESELRQTLGIAVP